MSSSVILMASGKYVDLLNIDPFTIDIYDIAHNLSHLCRFTGATKTHYNVAQHSLFVSLNVSPEHAFVALLHDATEAYLGDVSGPLKRLLTEYQKMEEILWEVIAWRFNIPVEIPAEVEEIDRRMCDTEQIKFLPKPIAYDRIMKPLSIRLEAMNSNSSCVSFLKEYYRLRDLRKKARS